MSRMFRSDEYRNHSFGRQRVGAASKKLGWLRKALHEIGLLAWGSGPLGALPAVTGLDMVVAANGRITASYTFLDPQQLKSGGQNYVTGIASRVHLWATHWCRNSQRGRFRTPETENWTCPGLRT